MRHACRSHSPMLQCFPMLAIVNRRNRIVVARKPLPRLQAGWALVRVRLAGICNTDIEILRGYHNFHGTLGHEFVGEVVRVASPRDAKWAGKRVVGEINLSCAGLGFANHAAIAAVESQRSASAGACSESSAMTAPSRNISPCPIVNLRRVPARNSRRSRRLHRAARRRVRNSRTGQHPRASRGRGDWRRQTRPVNRASTASSPACAS